MACKKNSLKDHFPDTIFIFFFFPLQQVFVLLCINSKDLPSQIALFTFDKISSPFSVYPVELELRLLKWSSYMVLWSQIRDCWFLGNKD